MAVRLVLAFADNEGHLPSMRHLVLSPFPPRNGDHVDPLGQRRTSSNSIRNLDFLPPHRCWISSPAGQAATGPRRPTDGGHPKCHKRNLDGAEMVLKGGQVGNDDSFELVR